MYDISSLRVNDLTLILLTWRKWWSLNNASKWQMGFNSAFKGLKFCSSTGSNSTEIEQKTLLSWTIETWRGNCRQGMPRTWQLLERNSTKRVLVFLSSLQLSQLCYLRLTLVDDFSLKQHLNMCAIGAAYVWRPCFWKIIALPLHTLNWPTQGNEDQTKSKLFLKEYCFATPHVKLAYTR